MTSGVESTDWLPLTPGEEVLWAGTPSLAPATLPMAIGFGLSMVGVWLSREVEVPRVPEQFALVLVPIGLAIVAWAYLSRWSTRYVFTTKAIYEKSGVFSLSVTRVPIGRVQNTAFDQSLIERTFSYGDIAVYTAGSGGVNLALSNVPDPEHVNGLVTTQLSESAASGTEREVASAGRPTS
ncbi:PH domain-containing protein [Halococcus saccharolyticus]|uniref:Membrane-flanked domain-containing protein n=1 Tax=Halococcus saccharolyticus DSM 5350 TaxID=1227455 RepID=M0MSY0_9EURY|nr:PH domain-containing protein [Halococcus saccharolyticus]EMA47545.1 membrane-flanked domain-containing protein [Halococcus saccharolyticus DSM 5350]